MNSVESRDQAMLDAITASERDGCTKSALMRDYGLTQAMWERWRKWAGERVMSARTRRVIGNTETTYWTPRWHKEVMGDMTAPSAMPHATTSIREARRKLDWHQPTIVPKNARVTRIPTALDHRHTVRELPQGYVSTLDARECREWAREVVR